jgi:hypothetical protein
MRALFLWRLIVVLLLVTGALAMPLLDHQAAMVVAQDDDDDDGGEGDDDNGGDDNDGGGDDGDDGDDDDDNGRGNDDKEKKEKKDKDEKSKPVEQSAGYRVEVECTNFGDAGESECLFTIVAGDDDEEADQLFLPETSICAEVLDGDFEYVASEEEGEVSAYRAEGDDDEPLTLILQGVVFPEGTATYWLETDEGVFPATGPGLDCGESAGSALEATMAVTPPVTGDTGTVVVQAFTCVGVPADRSAYDWYGACDGGDVGREYILEPLDAGKDEVHTAETDDAGVATLDAVAPGTWDLDDETANWCHAESDNVTSVGDVVVETGQATTVWLFYCEGGGS